MDVVELFAKLHERDVRPSIVDGRLRLSAPKGAVDEDLLREISWRRGELWNGLIELALTSFGCKCDQDELRGMLGPLDTADATSSDHGDLADPLMEERREIVARLAHMAAGADRVSRRLGVTFGPDSAAHDWLRELQIAPPTEEVDDRGDVRDIFTI